MSEKVTAVLITRGEDYPPLVWERLNLGFFDEILIQPNCKAIFQRYQLAAKARNPVIYVQDDDALVNYQFLFSRYDGRLTNGMPQPFIEAYEPRGCTLVGWGCYFEKTALARLDRYIAKYGLYDPHLLREADRIFTYFNRPFNTITLPHEDVLRDTRMYNEAHHFTSMDEALEKCARL